MRMWSKYKTQREIRGRAVSFEELWKSLSFFLFFLLRLPICRVRKLYHPLIKLEKTKAKTLVSKYCFGHLYRTLRWDRL